jgi:hypothetical protein
MKLAIVITVLVGGTYASSYLMLLNPIVLVESSVAGMAIGGYKEPAYRLGGDCSGRFFAPMCWIDQKIRRAYWENVD